MKILVCISNVPDTTTKVRFLEHNTQFDNNGVQWVINPWDELALTRALELKEDPSNDVDQVTIVNVGRQNTEPTIRKALAIGADDAIRIDADPADAYVVATHLAEVIKSGAYGLVLCGIESSDYNGSAVGGMLAEFANIPSVSAVSAISVAGETVRIDRDIDGGKEVLTAPTPLVAIVQKGIANEPRIAAMRGIMMARNKPVIVLAPAVVDPLTKVVNYEQPPAKATCKIIEADNVKELARLLKEEAKVI